MLTQKADEASAHCRELLDQMNAAQKRLTEIDVLRRHVLNYARTREIFQQYKASGYSKKFLNEHQQEIDRHRAAKRAFNELGLQKLPSKKSLDMEYSQLLAKKKEAYAAYRDAREQARELLTPCPAGGFAKSEATGAGREIIVLRISTEGALPSGFPDVFWGLGRILPNKRSEETARAVSSRFASVYKHLPCLPVV